MRYLMVKLVLLMLLFTTSLVVVGQGNFPNLEAQAEKGDSVWIVTGEDVRDKQLSPNYCSLMMTLFESYVKTAQHTLTLEAWNLYINAASEVWEQMKANGCPVTPVS